MLHEELYDVLLAEKDCFSDILGQDKAKEQVKSALLSGRHIIIAGPPGVGKTTLARNIAKILPAKKLSSCGYHCLPDKPVCPECRSGKKNEMKGIAGAERFIRVQGSPDLTAEDLLGDIDPIKALTYGPSSMEAFTPGKIFLANNGILFFDEINRCPERLQNALLQVLEERHVTIGSYLVDIPADFIFIGTMNPADSSTEKLSMVFLDRFDIVEMGYPETNELEMTIVVQKGRKLCEFPQQLLEQTTAFVRTLRHNKKVEQAPSVRASIGLYERAQANALLRGRKSVEEDDVRDAIISVLAHRLVLKPSAKYATTPEEFLAEELKSFGEDSPAESGGYL